MFSLLMLDPKPEKSAMDHCDRHVRSNVDNYARLLCNVHHLYGNSSYRMFPATNTKHPVSQWAAYGRSHYTWLQRQWAMLIQEYSFRFERVPNCAKMRYLLASPPHDQELREWCDPPRILPKWAKVGSLLVSSRQYYKYAEDITWRATNPPAWYSGRVQNAKAA